MSRENARTFEAMLREDEALQAKLQELAASYAGDADDEQAVFEATVGNLAAELGLPFSLAEGREAAAARELGDTELEAVAGGKGFCFFIGGSNDVGAGCGENEGHACAYVGVTIPDLSG